MYNMQFAGTFDLTMLIFVTFVLFFTGLVIYLRREDRREGYPLESEVDGVTGKGAWLFIPEPKTFRLASGVTVQAPDFRADTRPLSAVKVEPWPGAPLTPVGDPMVAGVGPGSWQVRPDVPYQTAEGDDLIAPLRVATNFAVAPEGGNPLGFTVIANDRRAAGVVKDLWVDRSECMLRYYEVEAEGAPSVLVPIHFVAVNAKARTLTIKAIRSDQFALAPRVRDPNRVTMQEEDQIMAFFGAGTLYSTPKRTEPLL